MEVMPSLSPAALSTDSMSRSVIALSSMPVKLALNSAVSLTSSSGAMSS